jgi:hypothetical protein
MNIVDAVKKGRHGGLKFSTEIIQAALTDIRRGDMKNQEVADRYGMSIAYVSFLRNGKAQRVTTEGL